MEATEQVLQGKYESIREDWDTWRSLGSPKNWGGWRLSSVDHSVLLRCDPDRYLDALPAELRNEIEWAYSVLATAGKLDDCPPNLRHAVANR